MSGSLLNSLAVSGQPDLISGMPTDDTKEADERRSSSPSNSAYIFHPVISQSSNRIAKPPTRDKPHCKLFLLDGQYYTIPVDKKAKGKVVINELFHHLKLEDLQEKEYFSVYYVDLSGSKIFLNPFKQIRKQLPNASGRTTWELFFGVQFYATKPSMLANEMTRYLHVLQICRDIKEKWISPDRSTKLQLAGLLVQANCGDYNSEEHKLGYARPYIEMIYNLSEIPVGLDNSVTKVHKEKTGLKPSKANTEFFMIGKSVYKYGQQIFPIHDCLGQSGYIGASIVGLYFHKDGREFKNIPWGNIINMGYRKKKLRIRYHPRDESGDTESMFYLYCSEPNAKRVWRGCVEQHTFFRLERPAPLVKNTVKSYHSFNRNSELRFSRGRTLYQMLRSDPRQRQDLRRSLPTIYPSELKDKPLETNRDHKPGPVKSSTVANPSSNQPEPSKPNDNRCYMTVKMTRSNPDLTHIIEFDATEKQKSTFTITFEETTPLPPITPDPPSTPDPIILDGRQRNGSIDMTNLDPAVEYPSENSDTDMENSDIEKFDTESSDTEDSDVEDGIKNAVVDIKLCTPTPPPTDVETEDELIGPEQNNVSCVTVHV